MACWLRLSCLFLAYCSSMLSVPVVARSLSFSEKPLIKVSSDPLASLRKEVLVVRKAENEPDPDSEESGSLLHGHLWAETALHVEEIPVQFRNLREKPMLTSVADAKSENLGLDEESSIYDILNQNGLPIGLLPSCVTSYTLSDAGEFSVSLEEACSVDFDYRVYYAKTITGTLSYGAISDLSGIKAKKFFLRLAVTGIHIDTSSSDYIYFDVGSITKRLSISQFETIPTCGANPMDFSGLT